MFNTDLYIVHVSVLLIYYIISQPLLAASMNKVRDLNSCYDKLIYIGLKLFNRKKILIMFDNFLFISLPPFPRDSNFEAYFMILHDN